MNSLTILNIIIIIGIIIAGLLAVILKDLLPCIIATIVVGIFIVFELLLLKSHDIGIVEGAVGLFLTPVILITASTKIKKVKHQNNCFSKKGKFK